MVAFMCAGRNVIDTGRGHAMVACGRAGAREGKMESGDARDGSIGNCGRL